MPITFCLAKGVKMTESHIINKFKESTNSLIDIWYMIATSIDYFIDSSRLIHERRLAN